MKGKFHLFIIHDMPAVVVYTIFMYDSEDSIIKLFFTT